MTPNTILNVVPLLHHKYASNKELKTKGIVVMTKLKHSLATQCCDD